MPESGPARFCAGALSNERPYRDPSLLRNTDTVDVASMPPRVIKQRISDRQGKRSSGPGVYEFPAPIGIR